MTEAVIALTHFSNIGFIRSAARVDWHRNGSPIPPIAEIRGWLTREDEQVIDVSDTSSVNVPTLLSRSEYEE